MRIIFGLVLLIGVGLAGFAVQMTRGYMSTYQAELEAEKANRANIIPTEEIFVAVEPLVYGDAITPEMIKKVRWPVESMPEGVFRTDEEVFPDGPDTPRVALRSIEPFEPILAVKVTEPGKNAGVAASLRSGMRAFAIRVDVSSGVSGFLRPGDRVDVYWTGRLPDSGQDVTKLIQSAIPLVAVDQQADGELVAPSIARTVTVEATPQQVAILAQAQSTGKLTLALVGRNDTASDESVEIDQNTLLGIQEQVFVEAPKERTCSVTTRKNGEAVQIPIPCNN
ncbi:Flp pilus assembly protein CpaB [Celeribacter sp.]|uniref:Flp pilus assembly protein CpaB n=1 Tax=Celeribacter sp. TaxID=1890673 RepID=UPI003A8D6CDC